MPYAIFHMAYGIWHLERDALVAASQDAGDVLGQRDRFDGLGQMALESGGKGAFFVLCRGEGRQRDGGHVGAVLLRKRANLFDQGVTIFFRHADVRDENVWHPLSKYFERFGDRSCGPNLGAVAREHDAQDFARVVFVVNDQDPDAAQRARPRLFAFGARGPQRRAFAVHALSRQRQRDHEVASLPFAAAVGVYRAAVQFDDVFDDGQSQPESALTPLRRAVDLREAVEDVRQEFGVNSLSGVADDEQRLVFQPLEADLDEPSLGRELDGVR